MVAASSGSASLSHHPIEFDGVVKRFGNRTVLDDLSFTVPRGSVVGLVGPNGAGKSTAMRILLGLQRATRGTTRIDGHPPGTAGFRRAVRKVGAIIESPPVYKNASPLQNLEIRVAATGLSIKDADVRAIINQVGLSERADDKVGAFSLGMRQRMGLALALVGDPEVVVLDEPTNGLDPEGSVEIREIIRHLPERGATALVCTHRLAEIEKTCDYVVVLRKGRLVSQGSLDEILASASTRGHSVHVEPAELDRALAVVTRLTAGGARVVDGAVVTTELMDDPSRLTRALVDEGIYLRGLETHRVSLEEAFLEITRPGEEEDSDAG